MNRRAILVAGAVALPALAAALVLYPRLLPKDTLSPEEALRRHGAPGRLVTAGGRAVRLVEVGAEPLAPGTTSAQPPAMEAVAPPERLPVILLHGFFLHAGIFEGTQRALARAGRRSIAYDAWGFGWSEKPASTDVTYGYDLWTDQLAAVMDTLGIRRAHLVGQSMGGATACAFAARHPERVGDLVLLCPAGIPNPLGREGSPMAWPFLGEAITNVPGAAFARKVLRDRFFVDRALAEGPFATSLADASCVRGSSQALLAGVRTVNLGGIEERIRRFGALGKRSLVVWGAQDAAIPAVNAERYREIVKPERVLLVEGAGHVPQMERAALVDGEIAAFLSAAKE